MTSFFHKSHTQNIISQHVTTESSTISTDKETNASQNPPSKTSLFGGSGFFAKSPKIDTKNEPLSAYYEDRKKLIFRKVNILEDEFFVSQFLLKSQKKVNDEYTKMTSGSAFFFDVPQKVYSFSLNVKENVVNFFLIIHLYLSLNKEDKAFEIFLLMCKENKKKLEFIYTKINTYCKKSSTAMKIYTPPIAKILINLLSCGIKLSVKFCKTGLQNYFFSIYLKSIFSLNFREIKTGSAIDYKNEIQNNRLYLYTSCLFDSAIFHFYNYYPLEISTNLLQHCLELNNDTFREKNNNELILMMKSNFNCAYFYFVDGKYKEAINCLNLTKELILDIIQNTLNSKDDEKEFLNDLSGYSYLNEEKNSLFCLKIYNKRISKLHDKTLNLSKYIKENLNNQGKKASSVVLGSKKYELQLPLLLEQIKRRINLEVDLLLCQIEMEKKNYKAAYEQIKAILNSNKIKDDFESKGLTRKKRFGVNKSFKSLKTYQNIRVKNKIDENKNNEQATDLSDKDFNLIYILLDKIEHELTKESMEESRVMKKRNTNAPNTKPILFDYTNFKEMEKFFIFICNLSLFQLKILNESQPEYSSKRDDLPIIFSTPFRDCLTNSQRMDLDELETMNLSRYVILIDSKKDISPENLDYKYMKYKVKTPPSNDGEDEADLQISLDDDEQSNTNHNINIHKGRNIRRKNRLDNKGLFISSSNMNNSTLRKTVTTATLRKRTTHKRSLSFNDDEEDESNLESIIKNIKDENNIKFMNKNRKCIMEYLCGLTRKEKKFLLNNSDLLNTIMDNISHIKSKKNSIDNNSKRKTDRLKLNTEVTYSFSYEISQNTSNI